MKETLIVPSEAIAVYVIDDSCPSRCKHCFIDPSGEDRFDEARRIARRARELGHTSYLYATRPDARHAEAYREIGWDHDASSIAVRGELTQEARDWLATRKGRIGFSLHGANEETHCLLGEGSFERTLESIKDVSARNPGASVNVWCCVHGHNYRQVEEVCDIACRAGARMISLIKLSYLGRGRTLGSDWFLTHDQVGEVVRTVNGLCASGKLPGPDRFNVSLATNWGVNDKQVRKFAGPRQGRHKHLLRGQRVCPAGSERFAVRAADGLVYPCHLMSGDRDLAVGRWTDRGIVVTDSGFVDSRDHLEEPCRTCTDRVLCGGGCRAEAIAEARRSTGGGLNLRAGLTSCRRLFER
jgi:radical SAM protein with 4Fe4S-binding SPASM domain